MSYGQSHTERAFNELIRLTVEDLQHNTNQFDRIYDIFEAGNVDEADEELAYFWGMRIEGSDFVRVRNFTDRAD